MNLKYIFKIIDIKDWQKVKISGSYSGSSKDIEDGFIHFSTSKQLAKTLHLYFDNIEEVVLLQINEEKIHANLVYEESDSNNRAGKFPHLYGKLSIKDILDTWNIKRNAFELPLEVLGEAEKNSKSTI